MRSVSKASSCEINKLRFNQRQYKAEFCIQAEKITLFFNRKENPTSSPDWFAIVKIRAIP